MILMKLKLFACFNLNNSQEKCCVFIHPFYKSNLKLLRLEAISELDIKRFPRNIS